jgi:hypothetical protein
MILTKDTPQITPREKNRSAPMEPLDAWFLPAMRRNDIDFGRLRANQAHARRLVAVHAAAARA